MGSQHVLDRHTHLAHREVRRKSKFNARENIIDLIRGGTQMAGARQVKGSIPRTFARVALSEGLFAGASSMRDSGAWGSVLGAR